MSRLEFRGTAAFRYGLAIVAFGAALVLRLSLNAWFPPGFPYVTFFPAVVVTAYFAGARAAVLAAVLSGLAAWYFFIPPFHSLTLTTAVAVALGFYVFVVAVDIFFIDGMARTLKTLDAERARYAQLAESRDLLYRELHHRVSNNIQMVGALLRLQAAGITDGDARHALGEAGGRIEVIAQIQRRLHDQVGDPTPFKRFAQEVLGDALAVSGVPARLVVMGGEAPLHPDQATPVTLVMLECFNNALEHAFGPGGAGTIEVRLDQDGPEHVLSVRDDGVGPPAGFDPDRSPSLGLRIVRAMTAQLAGRFTLERVGDHTLCRLTYAPAMRPAIA